MKALNASFDQYIERLFLTWNYMNLLSISHLQKGQTTKNQTKHAPDIDCLNAKAAEIESSMALLQIGPIQDSAESLLYHDPIPQFSGFTGSVCMVSGLTSAAVLRGFVHSIC
jgi:hypothetical protein